MKDKFTVIKNEIKNKHLLFMIVYAMIVNIIIELLARGNPLEVIGFFVFHPISFSYNIVILVFTFSLSLFFMRKKFVVALISAVWMILGIANAFVLSYRITPFAAIDVFIMQWDVEFINNYLNIPIAIGLISGGILGGYLLYKAYKQAMVTVVQYKKSILVCVIMLGIIMCTHQVFLGLGISESRITNMQEAYSKFGFVTCFARSTVERGIEEPEEYSEELVEEVLGDIIVEEEQDKIVVSKPELNEPSSEDLFVSESTETEAPNVIVVQLESFFDPTYLADTSYSENPIPNFTGLYEDYSNGMLNVAVVGAGTANTEFEVLTGMSVNFFGTGEYPYETILKDQTCVSAAYLLGDLGYSTFAMHNNTGTFYERYLVYPNLGFDYFVSGEFMSDVEITPNGWIKDACLTNEIFKCLDYTEEKDFVFAVSVQGHGSFQTEEMEEKVIEVTGSPYEEELENQLEYYVNQLYEMDVFVGELVEAIQEFDEPTVLVLYGDHIPSLELEASDFTTENNYQTQYVICANFEIEEMDQDLYTYQLMAQTFEAIGIDSGVVMEFHQLHSEDEDYMVELELLQYDLLYGENYIYEGSYYEPTDMIMGVGEITFKLGETEEYIYVESSDFTDYSEVYVNDKKIEEISREDNKIYFEKDKVEVGDSIVVKQVAPDKTVFYESEAVIY